MFAHVLVATALLSSSLLGVEAQMRRFSTCPNGWITYSDADKSEGGGSCLLLRSTPLDWYNANIECSRLGAHLLTISSFNTYDQGGLSRFAVDTVNSGDCDPAGQPLGTCPAAWIGAKIASEVMDAEWVWVDQTSPANLNCNADECPWGSTPSDDSRGQADYTNVDGLLTAPSGCPNFEEGGEECFYAAVGIEYKGIVDRSRRYILPYFCEVELDTDRDGIPDMYDFCPGSTFVQGQTKIFVDANGCTRDQMDTDYDGFCNSQNVYPTLSQATFVEDPKWCTGTDNCDFVSNPDQTSTFVDGSGDACVTNGCNSVCAYGCDNLRSDGTAFGYPRDSRRACTNRFINGAQQFTERCKPGTGFLHSKRRPRGCEKRKF